MSSAIPKGALLLLVACSSNDLRARADRADAGDDALVVPDGIGILALAGGNGVLDVVALTLRNGPGGAELYAALKNDGDVPACDAAFSVELFDQSQRSIAAGIGALFSRHFYRLADGSGTVATCVSPGDVTMAALTEWSSNVDTGDVGYIVYRCPYFALDVVPLAGLTVSPLTSVARDDGIVYAGTLTNELDEPVSNPSVTVFPVNRVGRPVGVTTASGTSAIPPGDGWAFETTPVNAPATGYVAYPAGAWAH